MKQLIFTFSLLFLLAACGENNQEENSTKSYEVRLEDNSDPNNEMVEILLYINDKKYSLDRISGMGAQKIDKENYSEYDIPSDALAASQNYWAGLQSIYYVKDMGNAFSVRKAEQYEGDTQPINFVELIKLNKDETSFISATVEFVECYAEGEDLILVFKKEGELLEIWDAPTSIWEMYDWDLNQSTIKGKLFDISYNKSSHYLSNCKLVNE